MTTRCIATRIYPCFLLWWLSPPGWLLWETMGGDRMHPVGSSFGHWTCWVLITFRNCEQKASVPLPCRVKWVTLVRLLLYCHYIFTLYNIQIRLFCGSTGWQFKWSIKAFHFSVLYETHYKRCTVTLLGRKINKMHVLNITVLYTWFLGSSS